MNDRGKSDSRVVPAKLANKTGQPVAELVEERRLAKGNTGQQNASRTQGRDVDASSALERVRRVAERDKDARFTALLHHVDVDRLRVLADGGYSNAQGVAECERGNVEVAAPIKRGAMSADYFRPAQFAYDETSDTIRCPAGETLRPSGKHTRNRAIRYRTSACKDCRLKPRCTPGVQRTIHRLIDAAALERMEARIHADPSLMVTRRCTVEHPFGTIKRMSGGGRFLHARAQIGKSGSGALNPGLQHPPRGQRLRSGETDADGLIRPCSSRV